MAWARIFGDVVHVEKELFGDDIVYTVSGEGAEDLLRKCIPAILRGYQLPYFNIAEKSFMVRESAFNDSPNALHILSGLQNAQQERRRG